MTLRLGTSFPPFSIHILTRTCPQQLQSHLHNSHVGTASLRNQPLHRVILTVPSAPCDPLPSAPWILTIPSHRAIFSIPSAPCDPHHPLCTVRSSPYPLHCVILYPLHRVILYPLHLGSSPYPLHRVILYPLHRVILTKTRPLHRVILTIPYH